MGQVSEIMSAPQGEGDLMGGEVGGPSGLEVVASLCSVRQGQ